MAYEIFFSCSLLGSSYWTWDQTQAPALGAWSLSHWTTREVPPAPPPPGLAFKVRRGWVYHLLPARSSLWALARGCHKSPAPPFSAWQTYPSRCHPNITSLVTDGSNHCGLSTSCVPISSPGLSGIFVPILPMAWQRDVITPIGEWRLREGKTLV